LDEFWLLAQRQGLDPATEEKRVRETTPPSTCDRLVVTKVG
jgi:hypothetical protein